MVFFLNNSVKAIDLFWTNNAGGNFTNSANWHLVAPLSPPGPNDNANFTNNATYTVTWTSNPTNLNAFFNDFGGVVTQSIGSSTYWVTNTYILGMDVGETGTVVHPSGTLLVTNAGKAGFAIIGRTGKGTYTLRDTGVMTVDKLFITNNPAGLTNSIFNFPSGILNTMNGSVWTRTNSASDFNSIQGTWNMFADTNRTIGGVNNGFIVGNQSAIAGPGGTNNVFTNAVWLENSTIVYIGFRNSNSSRLFVNGGLVTNSSGSSQLIAGAQQSSIIFTNGGRGFMRNLQIGNDTTGGAYQNKNSFGIISGTNSIFHARLIDGFVSVGENTALSNRLFVTDAARVVSFNSLIGHGTATQAPTNSEVYVINSTWSNVNTFFGGRMGQNHSITLSNNSLLTSSNIFVAISNVAGQATATFTVADSSTARSTTPFIAGSNTTVVGKGNVILRNGSILDVPKATIGVGGTLLSSNGLSTITGPVTLQGFGRITAGSLAITP